MNVNFFMRWNLRDIIMISLFLTVIVVNIGDFFEDGIYQEDAWLKLLTIGLSFWGIIMLLQHMKQRFTEVSNLTQKVKETENNLELTHEKLRQIGKEYSKYLHKQFDVWKLSPSEKEVAITLLKGLSFKEIADVRNTKVKTVRQQASTVYKKSKVSGRHEFSAWFFEDMLV